VQLDEMTHDRETQPEPTVSPRRRTIRLAKPLKHMRQKLRTDTDARVTHDDLDVFVDALQSHLHQPAVMIELHAV